MSDKIELMRLCRVLQSNFRVLANQNCGHSRVILEYDFYISRQSNCEVYSRFKL